MEPEVMMVWFRCFSFSRGPVFSVYHTIFYHILPLKTTKCRCIYHTWMVRDRSFRCIIGNISSCPPAGLVMWGVRDVLLDWGGFNKVVGKRDPSQREFQKREPPTYGGFPKWWVFPPNHPFAHRVFHDFHYPFWGTTIVGNIHMNNEKRAPINPPINPRHIYGTQLLKLWIRNPKKLKMMKSCIWMFPKIGGYPQNGWWKSWKSLLFNGWFGGKTHHFWKHPYEHLKKGPLVGWVRNRGWVFLPR